MNLIWYLLEYVRWYAFLKILFCESMGCHWTFYDYVDEKGQNLINLWLNNEGKRAKATLNSRIMILESIPPGKWTRPRVDTLSDECAGLFEIRAEKSRVQYRLLGFHGPEERCPTLAIGIIKPGKKVRIEDCKAALDIKKIVEAQPSKRRVVHDFDEEKEQVSE